MVNFTLPNLNDLGTLGQQGDAKKIKSYLFQLTEQLKFALANIDQENFSADIAKQFQQTVKASENFAKLEDIVSNLPQGDGEEVDLSEIENALAENQKDLQDIYNELYNELGAQANSLTSEYTEAIEKNNQSQTQAYDARYSLQGDFGEFEKWVRSQFVQTAKDMLAIFSEVYEGNVDVLGEFSKTFNSYIRFSYDGIELGKEENNIVARLSNNRLSFVQKGTGGEYVVAYISEKKLYITEANVTKKLTVGADAHGFVYDIESDPSYGLRITYRKTEGGAAYAGR